MWLKLQKQKIYQKSHNKMWDFFWCINLLYYLCIHNNINKYLMNRSQYIREVLLENDNLSARQIMNIIVEKYPHVWDDKLAFYADAGKEKSESWIRNQLTAEISSNIRSWYSRGKIILDKVDGITTFTATDLFKTQMNNNQVIDNENVIIDEDEEIDVDCDECGDKGGIVYFLNSSIFSDVYKIGKTIDLEKRIYDLSKCNRYGVFNLKVVGWIKVKNYSEVERMFHSYFNKYRLYKNNLDINVDTELFKTNHNFYDMWKNFIMSNYLNNSEMKNEIIDYKL